MDIKISLPSSTSHSNITSLTPLQGAPCSCEIHYFVEEFSQTVGRENTGKEELGRKNKNKNARPE